MHLNIFGRNHLPIYQIEINIIYSMTQCFIFLTLLRVDEAILIF